MLCQSGIEESLVPYSAFYRTRRQEKTTTAGQDRTGTGAEDTFYSPRSFRAAREKCYAMEWGRGFEFPVHFRAKLSEAL